MGKKLALFKKLQPTFKRMHGNISTFGKSALKLIKDRNFQIGLFASTPVVVGAVISVEQYKKQLKEKQKAIEKVLRKHNAVIKELNDEIKISAFGL